MTERIVGALSSARRIGVLGDVHGNLPHLQLALSAFAREDIRVIVQVGDFGFVWPGHSRRYLDAIETELASRKQVLVWLDGNHEDFDTLEAMPIDEATGLRPIRESVAHAPRGWRAPLADGRAAVFFGGAASIDYQHRTAGKSWWAQEQISDLDIEKARLGGPCDVLFAHEAPRGLATLERQLAASARMWSRAGLDYADIVRARFQEAFEWLRPSVSFSGHYHAPHGSLVYTYPKDAPAFGTRAFVLSSDNGEPRGAPHCCAVFDLDADTVDLWSPRGHARRHD